MRIRYKLFIAFLAIIMIFAVEGLYVNTAISTMNGLGQDVSHNFRIYQDAVNYQSGNMQVETGTFLYLHDSKAMGRQLISEGSSLMKQSRDDLKQNLKDQVLLSDLSELEVLETQVVAASGDIVKAVDNMDGDAVLNVKLNTLNSRSEALNLRASNFVEKTNKNVGGSISQSNVYGNDTVTITYASIALSVVVSILLAFLVSTLITRPIKSLTNMANKISWGDVNVSVNVTSKDEIGDLARSFNRMKNAFKIMVILNKNEPEDTEDTVFSAEAFPLDRVESDFHEP